jgi:PKD repeat protein
MSPLARVLLVLSALLLLTLPSSALAIDVGVFGAPSTSSWNNDVVNKLVGTGQFDSVVGVYSASTTPTLAELQQYEAVLVYTDTTLGDSTTFGNNLADYMDAGGGVVLATFIFSTSWPIGGRIQSAGYVPFTSGGGTAPGNQTLVALDPSHAILDGVSSFHGGSSSYQNATISFKSGVTQIANWSGGQPLVGAWTPTAGSIVGLNFYPPSTGARSDFWQATSDGATLMANALTWVAGGGAPEAEAGGPYTIDEGSSPVLDGSGSTDPNADIDTYEWDCTDDGVYDVSTTSSTTTGCTYGDQMTHTVRLRVTDLVGNQSEDTAMVVVQNVAPIVSGFAIGTGYEEVPLPMSVTATDIPEDTVSFVWDFGDGSPTTTGDSVSHTYADDGTYTVTVVASDEDGGTAAPAPAIVTILNVDPTVDTLVLMDGEEGNPVTFSGSGSDVPADTVTVSWDFGDGSPIATGSPVTHTYEDDGVFTVTLTTSDEDGGSATGTGPVTISNRPPEITNLTAPAGGDEGSYLSFSATATDPGPIDAASLVYSWNWGDGSPDTVGDSPTHAFPDDGAYAVTVTVDDGDGGTSTDVALLTIANVDPVITSTPSGYALEANEYTYDPVVDDPGDEVFAWVIAGPTGASIDPASGHVSWFPGYDDAVGGPVSIAIVVDDGDGGTHTQSFTVLVSTIDTDSDGMPDGWEDANGLDSNDPTDALEDPDGDGVNNVSEWNAGTDPWVFDGPSVPVLVTPLTLEEVGSLTPELLVENSTDPQGDPLSYSYEVYAEPALVTLLTSVDAHPEDISGQTGWTVDLPLTENTWYLWRASANDGTIDSPWSVAEEFFVNEIEEAPPTPTPLFPVDGEVLALPVGEALFEWSDVVDPEDDEVTYHVRIWDVTGLVLVGEAFSDGLDVARGAWLTDAPLVENTAYAWDIAAVDEHGTSSDYSELEDFYFSTENEPPSGVAWIEPEDGEDVTGVSPLLVATEGVDPEGTFVQYRFEVDTANTFDTEDFLTRSLEGEGDGTVVWDLADSNELVELPENVVVFARVRGTDGDGVSSAWATISFFVRGENDPPTVPVLMAPEDDFTWETEGLPTLVIANSEDPEGDTVMYDFAVFADPEALEQLGIVSLVTEDSSGQTTSEWPAEVDPVGDVYWTARSVDEHGATSEWAFPNLLRFPPEDIGDDDDSAAGDDDDDDDDGGGCECGGSLASGSGPVGGLALLLALLPALALRRRRG